MKNLMGRRNFLVLCITTLTFIVSKKALAVARYVIHRPVKGRLIKLGEYGKVTSQVGDRTELDLNQGILLSLSPASYDFPILRSVGGGNQTVIRITQGKILAQFRKLTHPESILKIVNYSQTAALVSIGTSYCVQAQKDILTVGVEEGLVKATSNNSTVNLLSGKAAILESNKDPVLLTVDYNLEVQNLKVQTYMGITNIVTGQVILGNTVGIEEGTTVEMKGNTFEARTDYNYIYVINALGKSRKVFFSNGVRPFFGS